ncbi:MAG: hypothetical protein R3A48_00715 [Polyangiales bacterium]
MHSPLDLLDAPARHRPDEVDRWASSQLSLGVAANALVEELAPLCDANDIVRFVNAEGMYRPLMRLAEAASGRVASTLWAWASTSALVRGELADIPGQLALRAVLEDPEHDVAWQAFGDAARAYVDPQLFADVRAWANDRTRPPVLSRRAVECFEEVAGGWDESDRHALAELKARLG